MHFPKEKITLLSILLITSCAGFAQTQSMPAAPNSQDRGSGAPAYPSGDYGSSYGFGYGYLGIPYDYYSHSYYNSNIYDLGYSDGFNAGRSDRVHRARYNPRQHERSGAGVYLAGFIAGYQDGYKP
jgi:hypothetical protein